MARATLADKFMNEVVLHGGLPLTRANVYRQVLVDTGSKKAADMFAFSGTTKLAPAYMLPLTLVEFRMVMGAARKGKVVPATIRRKLGYRKAKGG